MMEREKTTDQEEVRGEGVKGRKREIAYIPSVTVFITGPDRGV